MRILVEHRRHSTVIYLNGQFDGLACRSFLKQVENLYRDNDVNIILNLEETSSINSTGIGACIRAWKALKRKNGELVFAAPLDVCRMPIETLGVDTLIPIFDDQESATRHFSQGEEAPGIDHPDGFEDGRLTVMFNPVDPDLNDDLLAAERKSGGARGRGRPRRGKTWHAVGHMAEIQSDHMRFDWDTTSEGLDADQAREFFEPGVELSVAFTMSLLEKKRQHATVEVTSISSLDDTLTISAEYVNLDEETAKAINRYVTDILYLRKEVDQANQPDS